MCFSFVVKQDREVVDNYFGGVSRCRQKMEQGHSAQGLQQEERAVADSVEA